MGDFSDLSKLPSADCKRCTTETFEDRESVKKSGTNPLIAEGAEALKFQFFRLCPYLT